MKKLPYNEKPDSECVTPCLYHYSHKIMVGSGLCQVCSFYDGFGYNKELGQFVNCRHEGVKND